MTDLAQGYSAKVPLKPGDVLRVSTGGTASVQGLSGAPSTTTPVVANSLTFGPYDVTALMKVTASAGTASYGLVAQRVVAQRVVVQGADGKLYSGGVEIPVGGGDPYMNISSTAKLASLAIAKAKKTAVASGVGMLRWLFQTDSTGAGSYGPGAAGLTGAAIYSEARQVANCLTQAGRWARAESWFGDGGAGDLALTNGITDYNPLVTRTNWTSDTTIKGLGGSPIKNVVADSVMTIGTWDSVDTYELYYRIQAGGGSFNLTRTGDAAVNGISTAGTEGVGKIVFTGALADGTTLLTITRDSTTNPVTILGCIAYNSQIPSILLINAGYAGSKMADWADTTLPCSAGNMIGRIGVDMCLAAPLINDCAQATTIGNAATPATFSGNLKKWIDQVRAAGADPLIRTGYPLYRANNASSVRTKQTQYIAAIKTVTDANNVVVQDTWSKWGQQETNPLWYFNSLHPNATGLRKGAETMAAVFEAI